MNAKIFTHVEHQVLALCIKTYASPSLALHSYARAQLVCKAWHSQIHDKNFDCLKILTVPIFKRFISALNQIDTTPSQKYSYDNLDANYSPINQQVYEDRMVRIAIKYAMEGHALFDHFNLKLSLTEIDQLIKDASEIFSFYEEQILLKDNHIPTDVKTLKCPSLILKDENLIKLLNNLQNIAFIRLIQFISNRKILPKLDDLNIVLEKPSFWKKHFVFFIKIIIVVNILSYFLYRVNASFNEAILNNDPLSRKKFIDDYYLFVGGAIFGPWWIIKANLESFFLSKHDHNVASTWNLLYKVGAAMSRSFAFPATLFLFAMFHNHLELWKQILIYLGLFSFLMASYR